LAEDLVVALRRFLGRQARFCTPFSRTGLEHMSVMEKPLEHRGNDRTSVEEVREYANKAILDMNASPSRYLDRKHGTSDRKEWIRASLSLLAW
jgi:hypothetical protein